MGEQFTFYGPEKAPWAVYGLEKRLANGPVMGQLVMDGPEKAIV